ERGEKSRIENEQNAAKARADSEAFQEKQLKESQEKLDKAIATLKSSSPKKEATDEAVRNLASIGFNHEFVNQVKPSQRDEVSNLLNPLIKSGDRTVRNNAISAVEHWATPENIPALLDALQAEESFGRHQIIRALGATGGNEKAAGVLAKLMETNSSRNEAAQALSGMKQYAEAAVLPLLQSTDPNTRREACSVLGAVGGKKSRQALEAVVAKSSKDDFESYPAKQALERVKDRLAAKPD